MNFKELQEKVNSLQDVIDGKDMQARLIENDMIDTFTPSVSSSEITLLVLQMCMELNQYVQKKGWTDKLKSSQKRLDKLLDLASKVTIATSDNHNLKLINRELHKNYQLLRVENRDLKAKLQAVIQAEEF